MMTWNVAEALTSTFDAAKPMPELAPVYFCQQTDGIKRMFICVYQ